MSFCPSQRAGSLTDLCTPRQRVGYYTDSLATSAPNSLRTQLAHGIEGAERGGAARDAAHGARGGPALPRAAPLPRRAQALLGC